VRGTNIRKHQLLIFKRHKLSFPGDPKLGSKWWVLFTRETNGEDRCSAPVWGNPQMCLQMVIICAMLFDVKADVPRGYGMIPPMPYKAHEIAWCVPFGGWWHTTFRWLYSFSACIHTSLYLYVYIQLYIYIYTHVWYVHICLYIHISLSRTTYVFIYKHVYTYIYIPGAFKKTSSQLEL